MYQGNTAFNVREDILAPFQGNDFDEPLADIVGHMVNNKDWVSGQPKPKGSDKAENIMEDIGFHWQWDFDLQDIKDFFTENSIQE